MRNAIIGKIHEYMQEDPNIYFLTGDLGYTVLEVIEKEFPTRCINVGIAEQNMIGIAAGLALSGKKVFVYSIIPFVTMRCFEQIRNDICYHDLDVTILGAGSGLSYGILGSTHFALEDIAILRPLGNMTIFSPADANESIRGLDALRTHHHPTYIRIGKKQEPTVYEKDVPFDLHKATIIRPGKKIAFITTGTITSEVIEAAQMLESEDGIPAAVIDFHTIKPLDTAMIASLSKDYELLVTVEEHGLVGGLGSAVAESLVDQHLSVHVLRIGTPPEFIHHIGTQTYLRKKLGLDPKSIYHRVQKEYKIVTG